MAMGWAGNTGNFNHPITAYMLADFADEFEISLPRMQLLISQMIKSVLNAMDAAKDKTLTQVLSAAEVKHIELCITIIHETAVELKNSALKFFIVKVCVYSLVCI